MSASQIPVIDVRALPRRRDAMRALHAACRDWGFFQVLGHGIHARLRNSVRRQMEAFFSLPPDAKRSIQRTRDNPWGFYDQELTKNVRDWKEIFDVGKAQRAGLLAGAEPQWPVLLPQLKPTLLEYSAACEGLARILLSAIGANLGVDADYLGNMFGANHTSFLRLNHYPACAEPAAPDSPTGLEQGHLGIGHHTDAGALTVLMQSEVPGLQVCRRNRWHLIQPVPEALVINVGDIVQVWSNDLYAAPLHRVITHTDRVRYSAAYFFNPAPDTNYAPLPGVCDETRPSLYEPINWGEFRAERAAGDYADFGEEVQISRFRIPRRAH